MIIGTHSAFRIVENLTFKAFTDLISAGQYSTPSPATIKRLLSAEVLSIERDLLREHVDGSKVSLALDCWTSPFRQAFLGIIASYITQDWRLKNTLIGFEHLEGVHTGHELAKIVYSCVQKHWIEDKVMAITTDNASNNTTLLSAMQDMVAEISKDDGMFKNKIQHIPCLSHIIQLGLQALLGSIRLSPTNDELEKVWDEKAEQEALSCKAKGAGIAFTLAKVSLY